MSEAPQRVEERPLEVLPEGRLPRHAAGLGDADAGRRDRLMRTALGSEGDPRGRADEDRLAAGVDPELPRLEHPADERVVERPDRQQRRPVYLPGLPKLAEEADQVGLRDPQLDVLAVARLAPAHQGVRVVGEPVDAVADRPDAGAVDPAPEV